jgi:hypothetical protein
MCRADNDEIQHQRQPGRRELPSPARARSVEELFGVCLHLSVLLRIVAAKQP